MCPLHSFGHKLFKCAQKYFLLQSLLFPSNANPMNVFLKPIKNITFTKFKHFFFSSCVATNKVWAEKVNQKKKNRKRKEKEQEEWDKNLNFIVAHSLNQLYSFCNSNICFRFPPRQHAEHKVNYRWALKKKKIKGRKEKRKWNTHHFHAKLFCRCISSASAGKDFIIPPWKMAPSGTVDKWTALIVLIILAYVCSWLALRLIWNMKLNHPHIKPVQTEAHHDFRFFWF